MRNEVLRLRRGVGVIFLVAGLLHAGLMVFATLYSLGRVHVVVSGRLWSELYYSHFLFMVLAGFVYLALSFKQCGVFYYEALIDLAVGLGAFILIMTATALLLVARKINPWGSLTMSAFLGAYGAGLYSGRICGFGPRLRPLP